MVISYAPVVTTAAEAITIGDITYQPWEQTDKLPSGGNYYLTDDVQISNRDSLLGSTLNLDLHGQTVTLSGTASVNGYLRSNAAAYELHVINSIPSAGGFSYAANAGGTVFFLNTAGNVLSVKDVRFSGCNSSGMTIAIQNGTAVFENCTFEDLTTSGSNGNFYIQGSSTSVTLKNCTVNNCRTTATTGYPAGFLKMVAGTLTVDGGEYKNNSSELYGGVFTFSTATAKTVTVKNANIHNNTSKHAGSAIYSTSGAALKITGCTITDNKGLSATKSPFGAVYVSSDNTTLEGKNVIYGNTWEGHDGAYDFCAQSASNTFKVVNPTDDTRIGVRYAAEPTNTYVATITGTLKGSWDWENDTTKMLDDDGTGKLVITAAALKGISLPASASVEAGKTATIVPQYIPGNTPESEKGLTWQSSAPAVATVNENGVVSGVAKGTAVITATSTVNSEFTDTCTVTVTEATVHEHDGLSFEKWTSANSLPVASGNYYLANDITLSSICIIPANQIINLCLNGHTVNAPASGRAISLSSGTTLTVMDDNTVPGKIIGGTRTYGGAINVGSGAVFNMRDITITGGKSLDVTSGSTTQGGEGGAVYLAAGNANYDGAVFNMYSGTITGNTATRGGAIVMAGTTVADHAGAKLNISGGTITGNTSAAKHGGFLYAGAKSQINITDAQITDNSTGGEGGAMYLTGGATAVITDTVITGNQAKNGSAIVTLGGDVMLDGVDIENNTSTSGFGAVHVSRGTVNGSSHMATLILSGATKIKNNVNGSGAAQNVFLRQFAAAPVYSYVAVDASGLSTGAEIGISLEKSSSVDRYSGEGLYITAAGNTVTAGSEQYFFADNANYVVYRSEGRLALKEGVDVSGVSVVPETASVAISGTLQLTETVIPASATNQNVTWSSDHPEIAGVDNAGLVTGVSEGTAIITVTTEDGGFTATCTVTVETPHMHGETAYSSWTNATGLPTNSGKYYLTTDVNLAAQTSIPAGADVEICLNGHTVTAASGKRIFYVYDGGKLTVTDDSFGSGTLTGGSPQGGGAIYLAAGAELHISNVTVTGNSATSGSGGAIYMTGATAEITNTVFSSNQSSANGGAIFASGQSEVAITGCSFTGNTAGGETGAIHLTNGSKSVIKDTEITGNKAANCSALTYYGGTHVLQDVTVSGNNNTSSNGYGAVHVAKNSTFGMPEVTLKGKVIISGNTNKGAKEQNVYLRQIGNGSSAEYTYISVAPEGLADGSDVAVSLEVVSTSSTNINRYTNDGGAGLYISPEGIVVSSGSEQYFTSDDSSYVVVRNNDRVALKATHSHCLYGHTDCGEHEELGWTAWTDSTSLPSAGGNYYLATDVTLTATAEFTADTSICLNGHTITGSGSARVIRVKELVTFNLTDCQDEQGSITGGNSTYGAGVRVQAGATFNMYGGKITGNTSDASTGGEGAGVYLLGRSTVSINGSSTPLDGAVFNMYGGEITGNNGGVGSALRIYGYSGSADIGNAYKPGTANIYGGSIHDNNGSTGTIYVGTNSNLNVYGGEIKENVASKSGGAVYTQSGANVSITGGKITGNEAAVNGGALCINTANSLLVKDAEITGNKASGLGGGIYLGSADLVAEFSGKTVISGNTDSSKENNVYIASAVTINPHDLEEGSQIGISAAVTPTAVSVAGTGDELAYFTSDSGYKELTVKDGQIYIDEDGSHTHCVCVSGKGKGCDHADITWTAWESSTTLPTTSGSYFLTDDVTLTDEAITAKGSVINLCLNGHTVIQTTEGKRVLRVANESTVSITDHTGAGKITGGTSSYGASLRVQPDGTLNLFAGTITGNNSSTDSGSEGGAVYVLGRSAVTSGSETVNRNGGVFNMYGGKLTGNKATAGAAVRIYGYSGDPDIGDAYKPGTFNFYGGTISNNTGSTGTVYLAAAAKMNMSGGTISGNTISASGGGIYAQSGTVINISGGTIANHSIGSDGGAISTKGKELNISGGKFTGNSAEHGGAILTESSCVTKISGGTFSANKSATDGGAIYISTNGTFEMTGGTVTGNSAERHGGGIMLYRSTANLRTVTISGNTAGSNGGGVYVSGAQTVFDGTSIKNNTAKENGGGVGITSVGYTSGGETNRAIPTVTMKSGTISGNTAQNAGGILVQSNGSKFTLAGGTIEKNSTTKQGGGIFSSNGTTFVMTGGKIRNNTAKGSGGGLVVYRTEEALLKGGSITGNSTGMNGGGVFAAGADLDVQGIEISSNKATGNGGGIMFSSASYTSGGETLRAVGELRLKSGTISDNMALNAGGVLVQGKGSHMTMSGGTISGNKTSKTGHGGGLYISTNTGFDMTGGTIRNNRSVGGEGGGMVLLRSIANLKGGTISGNYAFGSGGGVRLMGATLNIRGGNITGNTARINGGGIRAAKTTDKATGQTFNSTIKMSSGRISGNKAKNGGGVLLEAKGTTMTLSGGSITGNISDGGSGGGIYVSTDTKLTMTGGTISKNKAKTGSGGGMCILRTGVATLSGGTITENSAKVSGGGIRVLGATLYLKGVSVTKNTAEENGGGIRASANTNTQTGEKWSGHVYMSGGRVSENTAIHGGGLIFENEGTTFEFSGGTISENAATTGGGGLYMSTGTYLKMTGGIIEKNTSEKTGAGVYMLRSSGDITGGEIRYNASTKSGGGILFTTRYDRMDIDKYNMSNVQIYGNTATSGGGVVVQGRATLNSENLHIYDNTASFDGGGFYLSANSYWNDKGSLVEKNTARDGGGGLVSRPAWLTLKGTVIDNNTANRRGGGLYSTGSMDLNGCTITNNTATEIGGGVCAYKAYYNIGAHVVFMKPYFRTNGNTVENNKAGENGGGFFINSGIFSELSGDVIRNNESGLEGGGIWMVTNVDMKDLTVTENKSGGNGAAFYIASSDYDDHSYIKGIIRMSGNMKVFGNTGKDMYLAEKAVMLVGEEGMGPDSRVEIEISDGVLTNKVYGEYNYEGGDLVYTITAGDRSLTDPEFVTVTQKIEDETEDSDGNGAGIVLPIVGAGIAILAIVGGILLIIGKKKKKGEDEEQK